MKKFFLSIVSVCPIFAFAQPQINSISPTSGPAGTSVTISGSGFNIIADSNFVFFNDSIQATVTAASSSSLTVTVPTTLSNGPIKVINHAYITYVEFSDQYYTYPALSILPPPVISSYSPAHGEVGDIITINGYNFSTVPADNIVYFGSVKAQVISATSTQITVYLPAGFKYDLISITVARQTGYSAKPFDVTFTVVDSSFVNSSFSQGVSFPDQGDRADSRSFADFDGDGKPDLISINYQWYNILRNLSGFDDFSFASPVKIPNLSPLISWFVLPVDLDGDGKLDVVANNNSSFSVLKNKSTIGNISFRPIKNFSTSAIPKRYSSADGPLNGTGSYYGTSGYAPIDTLVDPMHISAGDIDNDGKPDLAVSFVQNGSNGFFAIYRNTTDNGIIDFSFSKKLEGTSEFTQIKDIDGDGKQDVIAVIYQPSNSKIAIYRNTSTPGNISFAPRIDLTLNLGNGMGTTGDNQISLADINNDGKLDLIVPELNHHRFSVSLNQSSLASISFASPINVTTLNYPLVSVSDLDGDGKTDVVVADQNDTTYNGNISIYKNTTVGSTVSFDTVRRFSAPTNNYMGVKICDVDMDGKPDLLSQNQGFILYRNKANEPSIDSLGDPSSHLPLPAGTKQVVINGNRFLGATSVTFNGVSANSFIVNSKDQITAVVDTTAAATMKVRVESPLGIATLPTGSVNAPLTNFCTNSPISTISIIFKGDNGIPPYKFQYKINNGIINTVNSGLGDSVIVHPLSSSAAGTFIYSLINVTDKFGNGSKNSMTKTAVIKLITAPPAPTIISGPIDVSGYMDSTGATYTTPVISGASSYNWTVPVNATILSGLGTNSIHVRFTNAFCSGSISVRSVFSCGSSALKTLVISRPPPSIPGTITGPTNACSYMGSSTNANYSIAAVASANSYNWTVPTGATIISGQGTTSINVSFTSAFVSGNISVQSVAGCTSAYKTLAITKALPAAPLAITGPTNACPYIGSVTNAIYSVAAVAGVSVYAWTAPSGASIVSGQGTTSVNVSYSTSFVSGNMSVQSVSNCGKSVFKTLAITKTPPAAPGTITGPTNACFYMGSTTNAVYSIVAVAGVTSYTWTVPTGASIISGQGTTSIIVSYTTSFVSGSVTVKSVSDCGISTARTITITKAVPAIPGVITGTTNVCPYIGTTTNLIYKITAVTNATSYTWTVPTGAAIISGQGTTSISVSFSTGFVPGSITVKSVSGCGSSAVRSLVITSTVPAIPGTISGLVNVCANVGTTTNVAYSVVAVAGAASYYWTVPSGTTIMSGQGTKSILVRFTSSFIPGNISVQSVANCGSSAFKNLAVTRTVPESPMLINGPTNVCSYVGSTTNAVYSITAVTGAASYIWTVPAGVTIVSGQNTGSLTVKFTSAFNSGDITVLSHSNCGNSTPKVLTVTKAPVLPGAISGPTDICLLTNSSYSITPVSGAISYTWTLPPGISPDIATTGIISNSAGITTISGTTNSINVNVDTSVTTTETAIIKVASVNSCTTGPEQTLSLSACRNFIEISNYSDEAEEVISRLYPNPSTEFFIIDIVTASDTEIQLEVFDISGHKAISTNYKLVTGISSLKTNISELKPGTYFLKIKDTNQSKITSQIFIKQ